MKTAQSWFACLLLGASLAPAQELKPILLPKPQTEGGMPLMQALKERKSGREFSTEKLSPQVLSNLLWAAWGINRPDGKRTAPSAMNRQQMEVYVVMAEGLYLYNAKAHQLDPVAKEDLRGATGGQPFVGQAALNLVYVERKAGAGQGDDSSAFAETGFIAQNVYLYSASAGLATVVRGGLDRAALAKAMKLAPEQKITLAQTVGYPKR